MTPLPTPQQLRYLTELAAHQHFGRAAAACAVSQSALSAGVLALERQLDLSILDRATGKRVVFTAAGLEILDRARAALVALEALTDAAAAARAPMTGPLRLGIIPTIAPFLLPQLMPALRARFPKLRLFLREDTTERLIARLANFRLDAALLALPCACDGTETLPIATDPLVAALPPSHPLAQLHTIPPAALAHERLLLLEDGHCLRDQTLKACGLHASPETDTYAATSLHTLVQMVAGGLGIALLPRLAVDHHILNGTELITRPLAGNNATRTISLAWRPNSPRAADLRGLAAGVMRSLVGSG